MKLEEHLESADLCQGQMAHNVSDSETKVKEPPSESDLL